MDKIQLWGYEPNLEYSTSVAYFSMEFAVDQSLKIYSGGLGFLAGSHLRSAYERRQNLVGIGMLWKYGYYDQVRNQEALMKPEFIEKNYTFLRDTGITVTVSVHGAPVHVRGWLLPPQTFGCTPLFLLSTDLPENDELSKSITHYLYDANEATRIAQTIVLGTGGAMLLDALDMTPDVYHMNEGHAVSLNFYLYNKYKNLEEVRRRVVFTTHTPEMAGNEAHGYQILEEMSVFHGLNTGEVKNLLGLTGDSFNYTLAALKFARKANGVSKLHGEVARQMWGSNAGVCNIISITNAQNEAYWKDAILAAGLLNNDDEKIVSRKKELKRALFKEIANQCGKIFDQDVLTIVWARRFAGYKRPTLIMQDWERFIHLINQTDYAVQVIWAGKPYPGDHYGIDEFNSIIRRTRGFSNCAVLTGYELGLSKLLKQGADVWLNNPRMYREASGTSGMTAAMNGAVNLSMPDGWVPEFAKDGENCFLIAPALEELPSDEKDKQENASLMDRLEKVVVPMYYEDHPKWLTILKQAAREIVPAFGSARMVNEYYQQLYKS